MRPDDERAGALAAELDAWGQQEEDIEIEREMLEGLRELIALTKAVGL